MKYLIGICLVVSGLIGCKQKTAKEDVQGESLQPLSYTLYTPKSELFVEFKPLAVGQTSRFAAHLTLLGENFLPFTEGIVTVSLVQGEKV